TRRLASSLECRPRTYANTSNGRWRNACARCMSNVYEEAAAWVAQLEGRAPAADERVRFDAWIARSTAHAAAYEEALRTWRDLAAMRDNEQYRALLGKPTLRERIVNGVPGQRWFAAAAGVAAIA